jgi:3-dehydroquinate synthetase
MNIDWSTELYRLFAFVCSCVAVGRFYTSNINRRLRMLETAQAKRTIADCEAIQSKCPAQMRLSNVEDILKEIKGDMKGLRIEMGDHLKYHMRGNGDD